MSEPINSRRKSQCINSSRRNVTTYQEQLEECHNLSIAAGGMLQLTNISSLSKACRILKQQTKPYIVCGIMNYEKQSKQAAFLNPTCFIFIQNFMLSRGEH